MSATAHSPPPVESFVEVLPVPPLQERRRGVVRFIGLTDFAEGEWVGVELVGSEGRNDGAVKGQSYFRCLPGQGVFVRPNLVVPYGSSHNEEVGAAPPPPDPALTARIAALEEQLASAQQQAAREEEEKAALRAEVQRAREDAAAATAAAAAKRAADEDDELAAQVRQEEERLALQRQLQACQAELYNAQETAKAAVGRQTAAEVNVKSLQDELKIAHAALTKTQTEQAAAAAAAAAPPTSSLPRVDATTAAEVERLRSALQRSEAALLELRAEKDSGAAAAAKEMVEKLQAQLDAAEKRASEAERRLQEAQQQHSEVTAEASTAQDTALAQLRAQVEAQKAASAKLDESRALEIRALEERLSNEHAAALRAHEAASEAAITAAQREKEELHELCQLLEDELKEEKSQSDELARLVEQLGAEKAAAESAVGSAQVQTVQERDRLRREVEDGRAREVQLKTALEIAQAELDTVLEQQQQQQPQVAAEGTASSTFAASLASTAEPNESSAAALEKCRNALDEAELRLLQLSSTEQVAQALQQRCDELDHTLQTQRQEAQQRLAALQASAAAAHAKAAEEVLLWKRQCVAAQRQVVDLGSTVEQLQQQVAHGGGLTQRSAPSAAASPLDAVRERRYEEKIAALTRQLLAFHDVRLSAVAAAMSFSSASCGAVAADGGPVSLTRPLVRVLDFSTPEACTASTQSLFR